MGATRLWPWLQTPLIIMYCCPLLAPALFTATSNAIASRTVNRQYMASGRSLHYMRLRRACANIARVPEFLLKMMDRREKVHRTSSGLTFLRSHFVPICARAKYFHIKYSESFYSLLGRCCCCDFIPYYSPLFSGRLVVVVPLHSCTEVASMLWIFRGRNYDSEPHMCERYIYRN